MVTIVQGEDRTLNLTFSKGGVAYDLTGATGIAAVFPGATGTVTKSLGDGVTVTNAAAGQISVTFTDTDTDLLKVKDYQTVEFVVEFGANRRIFQETRLLSVKKRI